MIASVPTTIKNVETTSTLSSLSKEALIAEIGFLRGITADAVEELARPKREEAQQKYNEYNTLVEELKLIIKKAQITSSEELLRTINDTCKQRKVFGFVKVFDINSCTDWLLRYHYVQLSKAVKESKLKLFRDFI